MSPLAKKYSQLCKNFKQHVLSEDQLKSFQTEVNNRLSPSQISYIMNIQNRKYMLRLKKEIRSREHFLIFDYIISNISTLDPKKKIRFSDLGLINEIFEEEIVSKIHKNIFFSTELKNMLGFFENFKKEITNNLSSNNNEIQKDFENGFSESTDKSDPLFNEYQTLIESIRNILEIQKNDIFFQMDNCKSQMIRSLKFKVNDLTIKFDSFFTKSKFNSKFFIINYKSNWIPTNILNLLWIAGWADVPYHLGYKFQYDLFDESNRLIRI
jgi:hypothetical protein